MATALIAKIKEPTTVPCPDCGGIKRAPGKACLTCNAIGYLLVNDPRAWPVLHQGRVK